MLNQHHPATDTPPSSRLMPNLRRGGAFASAGLALMLLLGACGDDGGSNTATDATDGTEQPQGDASGSGSEDGSDDGTGDADSTPPEEDLPPEDPSNAADGDNMLVDDPGADAGGDVDPAAGGSTFNPVGGSWTLESLTIEGDMAIPLEGGTLPTLVVQGTDISGTDGCNSYSGTVAYDIAGDSFAAGDDIISTEIACPDVPASEWFHQALNAATTFTSEPGVLILTDNAEFPTTMRFVFEAVPENPEEEEAAAPIEAAPITEDVEDLSESYIGLSLEDAEALAQSNDHPFRVMHLDGEEFGGTADVVLDRINAKVIDGVVTEAYTG